MSAEQIAAIVRDHEAATGVKDHSLVFSDQPAGNAETPTQEVPQQAASEQTPAAAQAVTPPVQTAPAAAVVQPESEAPVATSNGGSTIPFAVLRGTRERLAAATASLEELRTNSQREIEQLRQQLAAQPTPATSTQQEKVQAAADRAGLVDENGRPIDVSTIDISHLRDSYPAELVNLIAGLQQKVIHLESRDTSRARQETLTAEEQQQRDIDSVGAWAKWQVDPSDVMWNAANAALNALGRDPAWGAKSRVERMEEVARQFGAASTPAAAAAAPPLSTAGTPGTKTADALRSAQQRSVPLSHSDLPAGTPAAQNEREQLANLDATDLQARMQNMTPEEQDAFIQRYA